MSYVQRKCFGKVMKHLRLQGEAVGLKNKIKKTRITVIQTSDIVMTFKELIKTHFLLMRL